MGYISIRYIFSLIFILLYFFLYGQEGKIELEPIETEILFNYYSQDGENSAVTGGQGTEELDNYAGVIAIRIPISAVSNLSIKTGVDAYTSASSGNIDLYSSGASGGNNKTADSEKDVRKHINLGYEEKFSTSDLNFDVGYSTEYDVTSINAGISYAKNFDNKSKRLSVASNAYIDRWLLIYPGEIRNTNNHSQYHDDRFFTLKDGDHDEDDEDDDNDEDNGYDERLSKDDFNTDMRYTINLNIGYQTIINKKSNLALLIDYTRQIGLLNTPFHRVYFDDGEEQIEDKLVRVENLPREKNKIAIGTRFNLFLTHRIITRFYYRFYLDDFGTKAHTMSLEVPVKLGKTWTFYPFIRLYNQTENEYFQPFGEHDINDSYYTSDYDLSDFTSFHRGLALTIAPPKGIITIGKHFSLKVLKIRYGHYNRTTGLEANNVTLATKFNF